MKTYIETEISYIAACHHCDWYLISNDTVFIEQERKIHEKIDH